MLFWLFLFFFYHYFTYLFVIHHFGCFFLASVILTPKSHEISQNGLCLKDSQKFCTMSKSYHLAGTHTKRHIHAATRICGHTRGLPQASNPTSPPHTTPSSMASCAPQSGGSSGRTSWAGRSPPPSRAVLSPPFQKTLPALNIIFLKF